MALSQTEKTVVFSVAAEQAIAALQQLANAGQQAMESLQGSAEGAGQAAGKVADAGEGFKSFFDRAGDFAHRFNNIKSMLSDAWNAIEVMADAMDRRADMLERARTNIAALRSEAGGIFGTTELLQASNALTQATELTEEDIRTVVRGAHELAQTVGMEDSQALDALTNSIVRANERGLQQLGVNLNLVGTDAEKQAQIVRYLEERLRDAGEGALSMADGMSALGAAARDVTAGALTALADALGGVVGKMIAAKETAAELRQIAAGMGSYGREAQAAEQRRRVEEMIERLGGRVLSTQSGETIDVDLSGVRNAEPGWFGRLAGDRSTFDRIRDLQAEWARLARTERDLYEARTRGLDALRDQAMEARQTARRTEEQTAAERAIEEARERARRGGSRAAAGAEAARAQEEADYQRWVEWQAEQAGPDRGLIGLAERSITDSRRRREEEERARGRFGAGAREASDEWLRAWESVASTRAQIEGQLAGALGAEGAGQWYDEALERTLALQDAETQRLDILTRTALAQEQVSSSARNTSEAYAALNEATDIASWGTRALQAGMTDMFAALISGSESAGEAFEHAIGSVLWSIGQELIGLGAGETVKAIISAASYDYAGAGLHAAAAAAAFASGAALMLAGNAMGGSHRGSAVNASGGAGGSPSVGSTGGGAGGPTYQVFIGPGSVVTSDPNALGRWMVKTIGQATDEDPSLGTTVEGGVRVVRTG